MATKHTDGCFQKAEDDEPLFTLLARDPLAPGLVREWAHQRLAAGKDNAHTREAFAVADKMEAWRREHRPDA